MDQDYQDYFCNSFPSRQIFTGLADTAALEAGNFIGARPEKLTAHWLPNWTYSTSLSRIPPLKNKKDPFYYIRDQGVLNVAIPRQP